MRRRLTFVGIPVLGLCFLLLFRGEPGPGTEALSALDRDPETEEFAVGGLPAAIGSSRAMAGDEVADGPELTALMDLDHPGEAVRAGFATLLGEMDRILPTARWTSARWAILVVSATTGDTLLALDPGLALAPASNAKLFTTAAALAELGPDFRYPTFMLGDGPIRDGVLEGDLILYGTGDPSISDRGGRAGTRTLRSLALELRTAGVLEIRGDVVGDGSFFSGVPRHDSWNPDDLNDWFTAPVSALSFNENVATVRIVPGLPGTPPLMRTLPDGAPLAVDNRAVTTNGSRSSLMLTRDAPTDPVRLVGEMGRSAGDAWRVLTVPDPALFAASVLRRILAEEGIIVRGGIRTATTLRESRVTGERTWAPAMDGPAAPSVLAMVHSPPLSELLEVVNHQSHNLFAESILWTLGRLRDGDGSFEGGSRAATHILAEALGIAPGEIRIVDGSGLSPENRSTPGALVQTMEGMRRSAHFPVFLATLPEAGNTRGLRRMYRSPAAGNLRAKTGTIDQVSALSGVVTTGDGEQLLFSILANRVPSTSAAKRLEDRIGVELASFRRPGGATPARAASAPAAGADQVTVD